MIQLHSIKPKSGAAKAPRNRVGRGNASGHGTYSGRGVKGQTARSGGRRRPGFEGGQTPLSRRMPKLKGFRSPNKVIFQVVNLSQLNVFNDNDEVSYQTLLERALIRKKVSPVKILGMGKLSKKLTVRTHKVSKVARAKIIAAGGKVL